jgi:drug/metabolite transporter (DMT)-like permease
LQIGNLLAVSGLLTNYITFQKYWNDQGLVVNASPIFIPLIVAMLIGLMVSILLIIGAKKSKPALLIPYVVFAIMGIVIGIIFTTLNILLIVESQGSTGPLSCFGPLFSILLQIYFCNAVIGLYRQQKAENQLKKGQNVEA